MNSLLKILTDNATLAITINDEVAHEDSDTINKKLLNVMKRCYTLMGDKH
jgi:hypothetical protein